MDEAETETPAPVAPGTGGGDKKELRGISRRSSLNLVRLLSTLDWKQNGPCLHVSLTYGKFRFPRGKTELLAAKAALVRDLGRQSGFCGLWRLEYQSRESEAEKSARIQAGVKRTKGQGGSQFVPHWHVLLWIGETDPANAESWLRGWWAAFSGNSSFYGVKITSGDARATWYLSLHAGKKNQSPPFAVGRWWGYIHRDKVIASCDVHQTGDVLDRELVWVARLYRRATGARTRNGKGFTWFLPRLWQGEVAAWVRGQLLSERAEKNRGKNPF